jgi:thiol:disulfide interchange protein
MKSDLGLPPFAILAFVAAISTCVACDRRAKSDSTRDEGGAATLGSSSQLPRFDPSRNAEQDIRDAVAEAGRTHRNVLVDVGGDWCSWCHAMDAFIEANRDVRSVLAESYVVVKVNVSPENENERALARFPAPSGYPHLYVLDGSGQLLHSQDTGELEAGRSYDHGAFVAFLRKWAPAR